MYIFRRQTNLYRIGIDCEDADGVPWRGGGRIELSEKAVAGSRQPRARSLLPLVLPAAILVLALGGCGGSTTARPAVVSVGGLGSGHVAVSVPTISPYPSYPTQNGYVKGDGDGERRLYDDRHIRHFGHAAGRTDFVTIAVLVKHYFDIALANDASGVCALSSSRIEASPNISLLPMDYRSPLTNALHGESCLRFMMRFLQLSHAQLAFAEVPTLKVVEVRVSDARALAVLAFRRIPEREIALRREGGRWKIDALLDSAIP